MDTSILRGPLCTDRQIMDIWTSQRVDVQEETRSKARECAAKKAYGFLVNNGLWMNLADAEITPTLENSINQLQELYQKKYVEKPKYTIHEDNPGWHCVCTCSGLEGWGRANGKTQAKKKAAFMVLARLMKSAGFATKEMDAAMWESMRICE